MLANSSMTVREIEGYMMRVKIMQEKEDALNLRMRLERLNKEMKVANPKRKQELQEMRSSTLEKQSTLRCKQSMRSSRSKSRQSETSETEKQPSFMKCLLTKNSRVVRSVGKHLNTCSAVLILLLNLLLPGLGTILSVQFVQDIAESSSAKDSQVSQQVAKTKRLGR